MLKGGGHIHHPKAALLGRFGQTWSAGGQRGDYISISRAHCRQHPAFSHLGRLGSLDRNRDASNCLLQTILYALQVKGQIWLGARFARHMWPSQYENSVNNGRMDLDFWVHQISFSEFLQDYFQSNFSMATFILLITVIYTLFFTITFILIHYIFINFKWFHDPFSIQQLCQSTGEAPVRCLPGRGRTQHWRSDDLNDLGEGFVGGMRWPCTENRWKQYVFLRVVDLIVCFYYLYKDDMGSGNIIDRKRLRKYDGNSDLWRFHSWEPARSKISCLHLRTHSILFDDVGCFVRL